MILKELLRSDFNVKGDINKNIDYITYNSKDVKEASLFFAVSGQKADGHFFIEEAIKKGAKLLFMRQDTLCLPSMQMLHG